VKKWTKNRNIFNNDILLLPINVGRVHWCLAVIHPNEKKIQLFDSKHWPLFEVLEALEKYVVTETQKKLNLEITGWTKQLAMTSRDRTTTTTVEFSCASLRSTSVELPNLSLLNID
jgi:Ulp1 family protease